MGIFRQFPYSNFHDLNLDWLLSKMKELGIDVDNFETEITELFENLKKDFEDFTFSVDDKVIAEVDKWLEEHPEATTTVVDGSISLEKLTESLKYWVLCPSEYNFKNMGKLPYRRFSESGMQGGVCTNSHIFYQYSNNNNEITKFNIDSGIVINRAYINLGHCNSMSFIEDENKLLCYGTFGEDSLPYNKLTVIDGDSLTVLDEINLFIPDEITVDIINPVHVYGFMCAFDNVNNSLYVAGQCYSKSSETPYIIKYNYENNNFTYVEHAALPKKLATSASDMCFGNKSIFILTSEQPQIIILNNNYEIEHSIPVNRKISNLTYASEFESISIVNSEIITSYRGSCYKNLYGGGSYCYAKSDLANSVEDSESNVPEFQTNITVYVNNNNTAYNRNGSYSNPFNNIYEALNCAYNFSNITIIDQSTLEEEFVIAVEHDQNVVVNAANSVVNYGIRMDGGTLATVRTGISYYTISENQYFIYLENESRCTITSLPKTGGDVRANNNSISLRQGSILTLGNCEIKTINAITIDSTSSLTQSVEYAPNADDLIRNETLTTCMTKKLHGFHQRYNGDPTNLFIPIKCNITLQVTIATVVYYLSGAILGNQCTWYVNNERINFRVVRNATWGQITIDKSSNVGINSLEVWT